MIDFHSEYLMQEVSMNKLLSAAALISFVIIPTQQTAVASINWMGHAWNITSGGMAGVAQGNPSNVSVDADGYLHLKITNNGGTWTAAELFTVDKLGFGTYCWQIDGAVDKLDKNVVVGLYPYGPAAGIGNDGTNEIDIEYARWGNSAWDNGNWTVYPASGNTVGSNTYNFTLTGTYTTSTFVWNSTSIVFKSQEGFKTIGDNTNIINTWTYSPSNATTNIPQQAVPLGMNLWCYQAPPSDGRNVEIIIRSFQFIAPGATVVMTGAKRGSFKSHGFMINQETKTLRLDKPAKYDLSAAILDLRGRVVGSARIPAGANGVSLSEMPTGVYMVKFNRNEIAYRTFIIQ